MIPELLASNHLKTASSSIAPHTSEATMAWKQEELPAATVVASKSGKDLPPQPQSTQVVNSIPKTQSAPALGKNATITTPVDAKSAKAAEAVLPGNAVDDEVVDEAVANLNAYMQNMARDLQFSINEDTGHTIITVLNRETQEVIRQIPPEVVLSLAKTLSENNSIESLLDAGTA